MPDDRKLLTAKEFARLAGVKPGTVTNWLRNGRLEGSKSNGRWMIPADQLNKMGSKASTESQEKMQDTPSGKTQSRETKMYSIAEFAAITYLTELGVERWLKSGRLNGNLDENGTWRVDPSSLQLPHLKHLLRNS